jgi:hypothetical protein
MEKQNDLCFDAWTIVYQHIVASKQTQSPSLVFYTLTFQSQQCVRRELLLRKKLVEKILLNEYCQQQQTKHKITYHANIQQLLQPVTSTTTKLFNYQCRFWYWIYFTSEIDSFEKHIINMTNTIHIRPWLFITEIIVDKSHIHCVCVSRCKKQNFTLQELHNWLLNRWFVSCFLSQWNTIAMQSK